MINLHLGHPQMRKTEWEKTHYKENRQQHAERGHQSPTVTKPSCTGEPLTYRTIMLCHMDTKQHQKNLIAKPFTEK